jgi:hypothetical protein
MLPGDTSRGPWLVRHTYQRILFQARFVDRLLGRLLDRLEAEGMLEEAAVVVTADHGLVMDPGALLRELSPLPEAGGPVPVGSAELDLLPVPFFVKRPGQRTGEVSERNVSHVDVVPTIAAELGVELPWEVDGRPAFGPASPHPGKRAADVDFLPRELPPRLEGLAARARHRRAWFAPAEGSGWSHRLLPHGELVNGPAPSGDGVFPVAVTLLRPEGPGAHYLVGEVRGGPVATRGVFLALVHAGKVLAVSRTAAYEGDRAVIGFFPEEALPRTEELHVMVVGEEGGPARPRELGWR